MNGRTNIKKFTLVGLDTNIFIYHFHQRSPFTTFTDVIFNALAENKLNAVTNLITLIELLSLKTQTGKIKELEEAFDTTPNLKVFGVDRDIAIEAAKTRRKYGFRLPDSVQLATALKAKAQAFISNDERLKIFKELPIILLGEDIRSI